MPRPHGQTRERMLDAAEQLFDRRGYGGVAVEDVTDAVGVKKPDLYNHFRDKAELYTAVRRRALDRLDAALQDAVAHEGSPARRLDAAAAALLTYPAWLNALRAREAETFLPDETRDFLFARSYSVLYRTLTTLLRSTGAREGDIPFLFNALIALASHLGPLTPEPERGETARRIGALLEAAARPPHPRTA